MGYGGQDELAGKSGITLNEKKVALGVVGHFPSHSVVEIPNILSASRHIIFSGFCLADISLFIFAIDILTCFATVADRSDCIFYPFF